MLIEESTAQSVSDYEPKETTINEYSTSFRFSLQIITREGFSVRGDATMTTVPARKSRPSATQIDEGFDDPRISSSTRRYKPTQQSQVQQPQATAQIPNTGPIVTSVEQTPVVAPVVKTIITHRVSGSTRAGLYIVLFLGCLFLFNGIVWPGLVHIYNQVKYGDAQIATFDLDQHHFITQDEHGKIKIIVMSADNKHNQVLTQTVHGIGDRALVTLSENGSKIDVSVNGQYATSLVSDGKGGYQWENS